MDQAEKKSRKRRAWDAIKAVYTWLKNRRSAQAVGKAMANNAMATSALAASVAAAGVGGYATHNAREAQSSADRAIEGQAALTQRLASAETGLLEAKASVAGLVADVTRVADATAVQLRAMGIRADLVADRLTSLASVVSSLPSSDPQTAALARQVAQASKDAQKAMKEAERAATAAAEAPKDEFARQQAAKAAVDAGLAAQQAAEAQATAEKAQVDAEKAQDVANAAAPRAVRTADFQLTTEISSFQVAADLPEGQYSVQLDLEAEGTADWTLSTPANYVWADASATPVHRDKTWSISGGHVVFEFQGYANYEGYANITNFTLTFTRVGS